MAQVINKPMMTQSDIESLIGKIMGEYKAVIHLAFLPSDYNDYRFQYKAYNIEGAPARLVKLNAGVGRIRIENGMKILDPEYWEWESQIRGLFEPLQKWLAEKEAEHNKRKEERQKNTI